MKRLLEYWRNSLADAGRLSPSQDDLRLALETECLFDLADFLAGQLPASLTKHLFDVWEEQARHVDEDDEEVWRITITLYPTSNRFVRGHRIRLDISSSNFPRFDVNPNTGEPIGRDRRRCVAENTVYHERQRPSHVLLPVIPSADTE